MTSYPFTHIDPKATIAKDVKIEPFTVIQGDVVIEEGSWIGSNVTIMNGARIGKNCMIFPGAVISAIPQDLKFVGEYSTVEIGDHVVIRECVTINRGTQYSGTTKIGNHCLIMAYSHIGHDCIIQEHCVISNASQIAGHVQVQNWVVIGGGVLIHQFMRIGEHAYIAGGSLIDKDVPPYIRVLRPLFYGGINSMGLKRRGYSVECTNNILNMYRVIYNSSQNVSIALQMIENTIPESIEKTNILQFIRLSKKGIVKRQSTTNDEISIE